MSDLTPKESKELLRLKAIKEFIEKYSADDPPLGEDEERVRERKFLDILDGLHLERLIKLYDQGENKALLSIIAHCLNCQIPVPERFSGAFCDAVFKWQKDGGVLSLDNVFNVKRPKGKHKDATAVRLSLMRPVYDAVEKLHKDGNPIDEYIFEQVAIELGITQGSASKIYFEAKRAYGALKKFTDDAWRDRAFRLREDDDYVKFVRAISKIPPKK